MTEVATPPPATEQRACPRCGASLAPDQEWCLSCGTAVGSEVAPTPRWRVPVALVGALLALLAVAVVLALVELGGDPQPVAQTPGEATATPTAAPEGAATPVPSATPAPGATPEAEATPAIPEAGGTDQPDQPAPTTGGLAQWPEGESGWTVVLASTGSEAEAEQKAREAGGGDVGVLRSDDYTSLRKGFWVVFAGQYGSREEAQTAAEGRGNDAYARRVVPR